MTTPPIDDSVLIQSSKKTLEASIRRTRSYLRGNLTAIVGLVFFLAIGAWLALELSRGWRTAGLIICFVCVAAIITTMGDVYMNLGRIRNLETELAEIALEADLEKMAGDETLKAAEKMLRASNSEVRRYYDLNLRQNRSVNLLGVACVFGGLTILGYALHIIAIGNWKDMKAEIVTAILGGIGTILANYIAIIYLKMNSSASDMMGAFHARLVVTQQLMLGNLIASRITDPAKQQDTFAKMAIKMVPGRDD